jgi:hypothetical protein
MVKFKTWTNEALAAQCIFPKLDCDKYLLELDYKEEIKELARLGVGGFCVFNGTTESARNVLSELQIFHKFRYFSVRTLKTALQCV